MCHDATTHAFVEPVPAPQPPALCSKVIDGELCATPEREPPHGKMSGHKFQPPADATTISERDIGVLKSMGRANGRGEPVGPPVTGDGDEKLVREAHALAAEYGICDYGEEGASFHSTECEAVVKAAGLGLARGRALGARDADEVLQEAIASTSESRWTRSTIATVLADKIAARRAGREE
jgi:hypothetical protein